MKSIVVNRILVAALFLIVATGVEGQKPAIDLISSHQQYRHPEAIIDTGRHETPMVREPDTLKAPSVQNESRKIEAEKKRTRQIGPSFESIFQKEKDKENAGERKPLKINHLIRQYQFLKFIIYITALN